jgi:hypothetical protein
MFSGIIGRNLTRRNGIKIGLSILWGRCLCGGEPTARLAHSAARIPPRSAQALTGSQFAESISEMERPERERAILNQLLQGNLPGFLRKLVPLELTCKLPEDRTVAATVFVMPEYLAIGSDHDFLRIPMNLHTAAALAERFQFMLPTTRIVDAIYDQSPHRFMPQPLPAGPQMASTQYYWTHNAMIERQAKDRGFSLEALVSGHKKDVVITNRLMRRPGQIAIYGWHRAPGLPIQPLSTVHGAGYADYSHGIRLVSKTAIVDGRIRPVCEILRDPVLANVLSDEGTIRVGSILRHL